MRCLQQPQIEAPHIGDLEEEQASAVQEINVSR